MTDGPRGGERTEWGASVKLFGGTSDESVTSTARSVVLVAAMAIQAGLLVALRTDPDGFPPGTGLVVLAMSVISAGLLGLDAYRYRQDAQDGWWTPDWRLWALGGATFGANLGFVAAYYLRLREADRAVEPSGWWKVPVVASVVVTSIGTALVNVYLDLNSLSLGGATILFGLLVVAGFTLLAVFYETRYVSRALDHGGSGWLFDGYHWVALIGLPVPGRLIFVILYIYRRRMLLDRVADADADIDELPTGVSPGQDTEDKTDGTVVDAVGDEAETDLDQSSDAAGDGSLDGSRAATERTAAESGSTTGGTDDRSETTDQT